MRSFAVTAFLTILISLALIPVVYAVGFIAAPEYMLGKSITCLVLRDGVAYGWDAQTGTIYMPSDELIDADFRLYYLVNGVPIGPVFDDDSWADPNPYPDPIESQWTFTKAGCPTKGGSVEGRNPAYLVRFSAADAGLWTAQYLFRDRACNGAVSDDEPDTEQGWDYTGSFILHIDATPPNPLTVDDGDYTANNTRLQAIWNSDDPETGIFEYWYTLEDSQHNPVFTSDALEYTGEECKTIAADGMFQAGQAYHFHVSVINKAQMLTSGVSDGVTVAEGSVSYTYDDENNQRIVTNSNGTSCVYTYDERYRLRQIKNIDTSGNGIIGAVLNYTVDGVGNRTNIWFNENQQTNTHYEYDAVNRLWKIDSTPMFTYDWVGNRLTNGQTSYTYDNADRLGLGTAYDYHGEGGIYHQSGTTSFIYNYNPRQLLESVQY